MPADIEKSSLDNSFETKLAKEKDKKEAEKVNPVVNKNAVVSTKKGFFSRIKDSFISEDITDIGDYILNDLIIPGIKDTIISALERAFESSGRGYSRRGSGRKYDRERTSYNSYYKSSRSDRDRSDDRDRKENVDYRNIILKNEGDAREIADRMNYYIHEYESVSVAMLFDLIDMPGKYTDNNWGWTREGDIRVRRVRNGWLIDVPEAEYLGD